VLPDVVQKHPIGGEVALLSDLFDQLGVLEVVEIMLICVEDAVPSESEGLVDLEVKADCGHVFGVLWSGGALYRCGVIGLGEIHAKRF
jgi:hypothetical protein